jgi:hypothetical protein
MGQAHGLAESCPEARARDPGVVQVAGDGTAAGGVGGDDGELVIRGGQEGQPVQRPDVPRAGVRSSECCWQGAGGRGDRSCPGRAGDRHRRREAEVVMVSREGAGARHVLADMARTSFHQLRPVAGDSDEAEAVKVVTRMHKTLIWERTRAVQRLRHALLGYFPAALAAFEDLDAPDVLELLAAAPDPASAAALTTEQVTGALRRARRRKVPEKAAAITAALRSEQLGQGPAVTAAYAATVRALIAVLATLNEQVAILQRQVEAHFGRHPDAEVITSQPGLGLILGARVLAEFGDDPGRYDTAKARKNYAATSPITRASGKKRAVAARFVHNDRLIDALMSQALSAISVSPPYLSGCRETPGCPWVHRVGRDRRTVS